MKHLLTRAEAEYAIQALRDLVVGVHGQLPILPYVVVYDGSAPTDLEGLRRGLRETGQIVVDGDHSGLTIYRSMGLNHKFRAWHDTCHLVLNAPMTPKGEAMVCRFQQRQTETMMAAGTAFFAKLALYAEIVGQGKYQAKHGQFPDNQEAFVLGFLQTGKV